MGKLEIGILMLIKMGKFFVLYPIIIMFVLLFIQLILYRIFNINLYKIIDYKLFRKEI